MAAVNCSRATCGHSETMHRKDGTCWACPCPGLTFEKIPLPPAEEDPEVDWSDVESDPGTIPEDP